MITTEQQMSMDMIKVGLKHACIVYVAIAYTEPETGHVVILLLNQVVEMKGLNHRLLCQMQCCMNGVLINEVPKFLALIPSETMHAIQIENPLMPLTQLLFH